MAAVPHGDRTTRGHPPRTAAICDALALLGTLATFIVALRAARTPGILPHDGTGGEGI